MPTVFRRQSQEALVQISISFQYLISVLTTVFQSDVQCLGGSYFLRGNSNGARLVALFTSSQSSGLPVRRVQPYDLRGFTRLTVSARLPSGLDPKLGGGADPTRSPDWSAVRACSQSGASTFRDAAPDPPRALPRSKEMTLKEFFWLLRSSAEDT